jgi:signal transduction histidine kinase
MESVEFRVLVVDDEPGMRTGAERALRSHQTSFADLDTAVSLVVETVDSAEAAAMRLATAVPDLVLLDQQLPGMSGLEFLARHHDALAGSLVVMISAYADIQMAVQATRQGAYDFLPKPFTPEELRHVVNRAAGRLILARRATRLEAEKRRVRFEFVRVLGHELKAPLGAVEGYLALLQDRSLGEALPAYDEIIGRCQDRLQGMRRLILDLLDMTRLESGDLPRELKSLDLVAVAGTCLENVRAAAAARGIALHLTAPPGLPFTADRTELEMIFNNLLTNAVKYNRDDGQVEVVLAAIDGGVRLTVRDTGIGMAPEEVARLFGEFVRIRSVKTAGILGTGLGLAILRRLVLRYDGSVAVDSTPEVGSTFTIELRSPVPPAA